MARVQGGSSDTIRWTMDGFDGALRTLRKTLPWFVLLAIVAVGVVAVAVVVLTGSDEVIVNHFKNNSGRHGG